MKSYIHIHSPIKSVWIQKKYENLNCKNFPSSFHQLTIIVFFTLPSEIQKISISWFSLNLMFSNYQISLKAKLIWIWIFFRDSYASHSQTKLENLHLCSQPHQINLLMKKKLKILIFTMSMGVWDKMVCPSSVFLN